MNIVRNKDFALRCCWLFFKGSPPDSALNKKHAVRRASLKPTHIGPLIIDHLVNVHLWTKGSEWKV